MTLNKSKFELDTSRIESEINVPRLLDKRVAVVGLGGAAKLACDLARCGIQRFIIIDFDEVEPSNVARQDHTSDCIGWLKIDAVEMEIGRIHPRAHVRKIAADFCTLTDGQIDNYLRDADLLIMATDSFAAQARGNEVALGLSVPVVIIGLYEGGQAGEVFFWHPRLDCCFRCMAPGRYRAHEQGLAAPVTSRGACIFDIRLPDAIAGMLAIGLLTQGANNRYGRLIEQLGERQLLQMKIDPLFTWNSRDIFREQLHIPADCEAYFSFVTIARSDPDRGQLPCVDCERLRGHRFEKTAHGYNRVKPAAIATARG